MKLTDWYSNAVKPIRKGVYELGYEGFASIVEFPFSYHYWDGKQWRDPDSTVDVAYRNKNAGVVSLYEEPFFWRGVRK